MLKRSANYKLFLVIAACLIFGLGYGLGNGRLSLKRSSGGINAGLPANLDYSSVNNLYQLLQTNFDGKLSEQQLQDGLKTGLVQAAGDPFTEYMNAKDAQSFNDELNGSFTGIGAELGQDSHGSIQVIAPLSGYPAAKAGLQPQDIITAINGKTTSGLSVSQAVDLIRGPAGSTVELQIVRGSAAQTLKITRQNITVPSVTSKVVGGIGYLTISRFGDDTASLASQAATSFQQQHVKGVVLDLRSDPGGLLDAAVSVSSLWLPSSKTVLTERHAGIVTQTYQATDGPPTLSGIPTVVLIDGGSASAAEITAAALHDNKAATLVGQKSYGKGSVQQVIKLGGGAILKVTVAHWYTPDGVNINKAGIKPDQAVVYKASPDGSSGTDSQMAAALAILNR
ncbi:MAG: S41 family peptidase [Candidatus Saccharimonadales bacterium]